MKNIETIMKELGIEIEADKLEKLNTAVKENYKPINDYQKQVDKVETLTTSLNETKEELKKFEGVNPEELKSKIAELEKNIEDKDAEYQSKIADRDFNELVEKEISSQKGLNVTAIKALLHLDDLKASKNQKDDISKAVKALTEADDSKMLFGSSFKVYGL